MLRVFYITIFLCTRYCAGYIYPLSIGGSKPFICVMSPLQTFGQLMPKIFQFGQPKLTFFDNLLIWSHLKEPTTSYIHPLTCIGFFLSISGIVGLFYYIFWRSIECPNKVLSVNLPINYAVKKGLDDLGIHHMCMGPRCGSPCSDCLREFNEMHKSSTKMSKSAIGLSVTSQGDGLLLNDC